MNSNERFRLHREKQAFLNDLRPKYILPSLLGNRVVTYEESNEIMAQLTPEEQVEKLFEILPKKNSDAFCYFLKSLRREDEYGCKNYPWLADRLEDSNDLEKPVYDKLVDGGVPFQINYLLPRTLLLSNIRKSLHQAALKKRHWVVLFGMAGTGKSVLAAEAVRDNEIVKKHFPGGIYWIPVGRLKDENALWLKMKKLFKLLKCDKELYTNENIDELTYVLRKQILNREKVLIVLDDVWERKSKCDPNVIKCFDIGCPILVTTKFKSALDNVSEFCSFTECKNDLLSDDIKDLLSLHVNCERRQLPSVVNKICDKCKGSPFITSSIGSIMVKFGNDFKRWENLLKKLETGDTSVIRKRYASGDDLEITELIRLILEYFEDLKEYFMDFVIFPEDVFVPNKVFEVLWGKDSFEVEEILHELHGKSLVRIERDPHDSFAYSIHDLYLEALKNQCTDITQRHKKLVNNYLQLCRTVEGNFDFSKLPQDDYIHYFIGYHMFHAEDHNMLEQIYFDLKFIDKKLHLDPKDLLWDYQNYRNCFTDIKKLKTYEDFVKKYSDIVYNNEKSDLIQFALFEPHTSDVYEQARKVAAECSDRAYFEWCNKENNQSYLSNCSTRFTNHVVKGINHAVCNADGSLVACVGEAKQAMINLVSSGEELPSLHGHTDLLNYCVLSSSGDKLVTASCDKTVKIFEVNVPSTPNSKSKQKRASIPIITMDSTEDKDMALLTFELHKDDVLCCNFSPDEVFIISSDASARIYVWQAENGHYCHRVWHTIKRNVHFCCFNEDGKMFGGVAYDTINIWNMETGDIAYTFCHNDILVRKFCFNCDKKCVISISDKFVSKWNMQSEQTIINKGSSKSPLLWCCCLSPDGNYLACGTTSSSIIIFNLNSYKIIASLKGHKHEVTNVMFTEDGKKLFSVSSDRYIFHDVTKVRDTSLQSFEGHLCVRDSKEHIIVIALSNDQNCVEVRRGLSGNFLCKTEPDDSDISACSLSYNCSELVYGTKNGDVKVFDISSKTIEVLPKHNSQINYIMHSEHDLTFYTCSDDKTIRVWKEKIPLYLKGHTKPVLMCIPFKRLSNRLLSCSKDGTLKVWDTTSGNKIFSINEGHGNQDVRSCDISPNEKMIASASADYTVKVWNSENGELLYTFNCEGVVRCCRFAPFSQVLISGDDTGKVILWHLITNSEPNVLTEHSSWVHSIYFSSDGSQVLSVSDDINLWKKGRSQSQILLLPSSFTSMMPPSLWTNDKFDVIVVIDSSILYILKKV